MSMVGITVTHEFPKSLGFGQMSEYLRQNADNMGGGVRNEKKEKTCGKFCHTRASPFLFKY